MSTKLVKEQIHKFLVTSIPEVLAIKGDWGVGKTYNWNKYIEEFKGDCALKSYSYVSLFGASSIGDIKQTSFLNAINTDKIGQSPDVKSHTKKWAELLKDTKIKHVGSIGAIINSVSQFALNKTIICFDDLERHSKGITIKDFMGLVSYLKEQKGCKVVLLLNEETGDETFNDYQKYKEKVVDKQLHFEPTAEECFDAMVTEESELRDFSRTCCTNLDIKNKRIISKIESHIKESLEVLEESEFDLSIKEKIVHAIVLFSCCYYSQGINNIPNFEYVVSVNNVSVDKEERWDEGTTKKWSEFLNTYGYHFADEIDVVLANGIKQGFFDCERLASLCRHKQNELDVQNRSVKLNEAWDVFHGSFDNNEADFVLAIEEGLKEVAANFSCSQYSAGISILRDIGEDKKADELTEFFIDSRKHEPEIFNLDSFDSNPFGVKDAKFAGRIKEAYQEEVNEATVDDILELRKKTSSYNDSEAEILDRLTKDEIKAKFMTFKGDELTDYIRVFILLSGSRPTLKDKVNEAITEIAATSLLNKSRMSKFGR